MTWTWFRPFPLFCAESQGLNFCDASDLLPLLTNILSSIVSQLSSIDQASLTWRGRPIHNIFVILPPSILIKSQKESFLQIIGLFLCTSILHQPCVLPSACCPMYRSLTRITVKMHSPSITIITIIIFFFFFFFFLLGLASPAPLSRSGASPVPAVSYLNSVPTLALNTIFPSSVQTLAATAPPVNCPVTIIYVPVYVTQTIITEPESSSPSPGLHMSGPTS